VLVGSSCIKDHRLNVFIACLTEAVHKTVHAKAVRDNNINHCIARSEIRFTEKGGRSSDVCKRKDHRGSMETLPRTKKRRIE
jgi:hypothetical protein